MAKRTKKRPGRMKTACHESLDRRQEIEAAAALQGLTLRVSEITSGTGSGRLCLHWQFNLADTAVRVLDWWPSTGTWRGRGRSGKAESAWDALSAAAAILGGLAGELQIDMSDEPVFEDEEASAC